jgi:hypothetical protein
VRAISPAGGAVYLGGFFTTVGGAPRSYAAAVDGSSGALHGWNPMPDATVYGIAVGAGGIYLGGGFTTVQGIARGGVACVDPTSGTPTSWNPAANSTVTAIAVDDARVIVGGSFTTLGVTARNRLAALDATTAVPTDWNPDASGTVWSVAVGSGIYAGGDFTSVGGSGRERIAGYTLQTTGVGDPVVTPGVALAPPFPNPARGPVRLAFTLAEAAHVRLVVLDLQGRAVTTLVDAPLPAGRHEARWDAIAAAVAPGTYFVRGEVGGRGVARTVVLLR